MLPERLTFALAVFATIALVYLSMVHKWTWEETMVGVLAGILAAMIVGRIAGRISGKELSKNVEPLEEPPPSEKPKNSA
ncbi:MAG: hypothetical protein L6Q71_09535 [Planctomycetes bacterium]|nr:hypothetical protein [Planctomycetota bacterium]NUQ34761.1 hypothetical protein [Planctomycetaceae bacterium]